MKKVLYSIVLVTTLIFTSCDYVKDPYPEANVNVSDTTTCPAPVFPALTSHIKKILIEDFTGHTCGNCPKAAKQLHEIDSIYPGKIIGLGLHVGGYAAPTPGYNGSVSTSYTADYRTTVGELYDATFGASEFGLPQGMFNRKEYDAVNKTHLQFYPNWKTYVAGIVAEPSVVDLQISSDYTSSTRKMCTAVRDSFLTTMSGTFNLVVLLTQDSIVDWQDYIGVNKSDYLHRHILRDAITPLGALGELIETGTIAAGTKHIKRFAYTIPADYKGVVCDVSKCHILAFVYNTATYEIIQSEEIKVIP
ncbi:MAG: Omp28-related outer membrane protein [Bacteroidota bacterium]